MSQEEISEASINDQLNIVQSKFNWIDIEDSSLEQDEEQLEDDLKPNIKKQLQQQQGGSNVQNQEEELKQGEYQSYTNKKELLKQQYQNSKCFNFIFKKHIDFELFLNNILKSRGIIYLNIYNLPNNFSQEYIINLIANWNIEYPSDIILNVLKANCDIGVKSVQSVIGCYKAIKQVLILITITNQILDIIIFGQQRQVNSIETNIIFVGKRNETFKNLSNFKQKEKIEANKKENYEMLIQITEKSINQETQQQEEKKMNEGNEEQVDDKKKNYVVLRHIQQQQNLINRESLHHQDQFRENYSQKYKQEQQRQKFDQNQDNLDKPKRNYVFTNNQKRDFGNQNEKYKLYQHQTKKPYKGKSKKQQEEQYYIINVIQDKFNQQNQKQN